MARVPSLGITPGQRFATGIIATICLDRGAMHSRHFVGSSKAALSDLATWCDDLGAKVQSISTPNTIFRDLQGVRLRLDGTQLDRVEAKLLALIGRGDLLDD